MMRFAWLALVACSLLPVAASAQAPAATAQGFAYCIVTDNSSAQATIWASPVFPVRHAASDPGGFQRSQQIAAEFLVHVGTLGGQGSKSCSVLDSQAEAISAREADRAIWGKRVYFIKIGEWRDVAWAPAPWSPAAAAPAAELTRYFYCYETNTDVPHDLSHTVATGVFARNLPGSDPMAAYTLASAYSEQFKQQVRAHGLPENGSCTPFDTQGEAEHQQRLILKHFKGFNMKFEQIAWTPSDIAIAANPAAAAAATAVATTTSAASVAATAAATVPGSGVGLRINAVTAELAQALALPSTEGAWVVEVIDGGAAKKAGIKPMDVVVEIAGQAVTAYSDLPVLLGRLRPGFQAPVRVWREGKMQDLTLTIPEQPAVPVATAMPASPTPTAPAVDQVSSHAPDHGQYCTAFITHTKSSLILRAPIRQLSAAQTSHAAMTDALSQWVAAVVQAHPIKWMTFPPTACHDNSGVFKGETFCVSVNFKHFGGTQMAAQFCNPSREMIDKRWADMVKADGGNAQIFPWPVAP